MRFYIGQRVKMTPRAHEMGIPKRAKFTREIRDRGVVERIYPGDGYVGVRVDGLKGIVKYSSSFWEAE